METVKQALTAQEVKIASVAAGFPSSQTFIEVKIAETAMAVMTGADEIDVVMNLGYFMEDNYEELTEEIQEIKESCRESKLKVILETGALVTPENIRKAAILALYSGADFIKTSTEADKVTLQGDATLENVKTKATEIADNTISVITLTGTGNALGAITVGSGGNLTLTANEGTSVTVTSVANSGTFTDNTGSVTAVTGDASLNLTATGAMPSDQTATGQVTLTAKPAVAEDADVSYQWQKQENGSWTDVSNPYTRSF